MAREVRNVVLPVLKVLDVLGFVVVQAPGRLPMGFDDARRIIAQYPRTPGVVWRQNTGAAVMKGRLRQEEKAPTLWSHMRVEQRFIRYGVPGMSDIGGILAGGRVLAIECKSRRGELSEEQAAYLELVELMGGVALVVREGEDLLAALCGAGLAAPESRKA